MRAALVLATGLVLAACAAGGVWISNGNYVSYSPSHFIYAAADRDFLTKIRGNPFDEAPAGFQARVLDVLQGAAFVPTRFTATPDASARRDYFLVVLFNGPRGFHPQDLCRDADRVASDRTARPIRFTLAFCHKGSAISTVEGRANATGSTDPTLGRGLRQAVVELLPREEVGNDIGICERRYC